MNLKKSHSSKVEVVIFVIVLLAMAGVWIDLATFYVIPWLWSLIKPLLS